MDSVECGMRTLLCLCAALAACGDDTSPARDGALPDAAPADSGPDAPAAYELAPFESARIGSQGGQPNFQQVEAEIDLHDGPFANVTMVVDLGTTCFPFAGWAADPPPVGQNWPADCDAFDRNFELTLDDPATADGPPAIELMRAITPFGGPLHLEIDVTDVANGRPGRHRLRAFIATWSDAAGQVSGSNGGWNVTTHLRVTPGAPPRRVLAVIPLWNGAQTTMTPPAPIGFDAPAGTTSGRIEYRATGHGGATGGVGCIGPAEEFCRRNHIVFVDEQSLGNIDAWRANCADNCTLAHQGPTTGGFDYCMQNPTGNIDSVRAPRANWCPGTLTPPFTSQQAPLGTPGHHEVRWEISKVAGGDWRISALYIAYGS